MSHYLLAEATCILGERAPAERRAYLIDRLKGSNTAAISRSYVDASSEEPEDVVAAALSPEMSVSRPEIHADAVKAVETVVGEVIAACGRESLSMDIAQTGERVLHAIGAVGFVGQKSRIFALVNLSGSRADAASRLLFKACIRALRGLPKTPKDRSFWEQLRDDPFAHAFARGAMKELSEKFSVVSESVPEPSRGEIASRKGLWVAANLASRADGYLSRADGYLEHYSEIHRYSQPERFAGHSNGRFAENKFKGMFDHISGTHRRSEDSISGLESYV